MGKRRKNRNRQQHVPMLNDPPVLCPFCNLDPGYLSIIRGIFNQTTFIMRESNSIVNTFNYKDSVDHKNHTFTSIWCTKCSYKESIEPNTGEALLATVKQLIDLSTEAWGPNHPAMGNKSRLILPNNKNKGFKMEFQLIRAGR